MDLMGQMRYSFQKIVRYWKNRKFRKKVVLEKKMRYLFDAQEKTESVPSLFTLFREKKRFYYFNTLTNIIEANRYRFRLSFIFIGTFLIAASIYVLGFSPYFRISPSMVIIERIDSISNINIAYRSIDDIYSSSIFSIDTDSIRDKLIALQKNIKDVTISRLFPNGLKIIIESYKPQFFVRFPYLDKTYVLTSNGILISQKANDANLSTLDLVDASFSEMSFIDYKEGVSSQYMPFILRSRDFFKTVFPSVNISKFTYFKAEREIHIALESGLIILMRVANDVDNQIASLKIYNENNKDIINS